MRTDFEELRASVPHNASKGQEAENLLRLFLNARLPQRFKAGAGFIIDGNNNISRQTDVIIYDAFNCPIYRASEHASIFPNDNVAAVVEVKTSLDKAELASAFENIRAAKRLVKSRVDSSAFENTRVAKRLVKSKVDPSKRPITSQTYGCLFAFSSTTSLATIAKNYQEILIEQGLNHLVDLIVVLDKGIITLFAREQKGLNEWGMAFLDGIPQQEGMHLSVGRMDLAEDSLDAFFRILLSHLALFRNEIDRYSTFAWQNPPLVALSYLASITLIKNPKKRRDKLEQYAREIEEEFRKHSQPTGDN